MKYIGAEPDKLARELLEVIPAVMSTFRNEMHRRRRSDLSVMQLRTLVYLELNPEASLSALAEYLGLTPPTVSQMVHGLVEKGMVNRQDSSADRRRVMLTLTHAGVKLLDESLAGTKIHLAEMLSGLRLEDRVSVLQVLLLLEGTICKPQASLLGRKN